MLNRLNQLGCILAVLTFGAVGAAHAQGDDNLGDGAMENPCVEADMDPCADGDNSDGGGDASGADAAHDGEGHAQGMVVPKGKIAVTASLGLNLSAEAVGDPIALAPDVRYGVMDKLDAGLYHSTYGLNGFWLQDGGGLCLVGDACGDVYNGPTGILANYSIQEGKTGISAGGGLVLSNITGDALFMDLKLGAKIFHALSEKMAIVAEPALFFSINERDPIARDQLTLPVSFMYAVDEKTHAGVQTGIVGLLDGFGDTYQIPLNLAGMHMLNSTLGVGGAFGFGNLIGKGGTADGRNLTLFAHYML